jgi:hypothetical protein
MLGPVEQVARQRRVEKFTRARQLRTWLRGMPKWLVTAALFAFCLGPTFISYQPYLFAHDDSDYLQGAISVSRAFWSGNVRGVHWAMMGTTTVRPPAMTLLGLPWGPLASWDAAGKCFITLAAVISLLAASCLYLLLRIGVKPFFLVVASVCVGASIGPFGDATGFMADSLLAWTALAAVLLIPYEARTPCPLIKGAVLRGIVWGSIFSLGMMTKISFLYFIVLIVPLLFFINLHHSGFRSTLAALIAFACCSAPAALYILLGEAWGPGHSHLTHAKAASFGSAAYFYYIPILQFLGDTIRDSPGLVLSFVLTAAALIYLVIKKRLMQSWPDFLALLIMIGFGIVVLASPNREIRFGFPTIVALPFLAAILVSGKGHSAPRPSAALAAGLVFCGLLAAGVPTRYRANIRSIDRADAILAHAAQCNAKHIILATDSPRLNLSLMRLAIEISASRDSVKVDSLASSSYEGASEEDFRKIRESDQVVFQDRDALSPPFRNQRVPEYERYIRQAGYVPIRVDDDVTVYSIQCRP